MTGKKILIWILLMIYFSLSFAYNVNIIEEKPNYIKFEISLNNLEVRKEAAFTEIFLPGAINSVDQGAPDIPYIKLHIAVPENGSLRINLNSLNSKNYNLNHPVKPVLTEYREFDINNESTIISEYRIDNPKYSSRKSIYEILPKQSLNHYDVIPVIINPISYNNTYRILNHPEKIIAEIYIDGNFPKNISDKSEIDSIYKDMILNSKYGLNYKQHRSKDFYTSEFSRFPFWYKIEISENGFYVLDRQALNNLPINDIDPRQIRIFSTGGAMMTTTLNADGHEFKEIPILVIGEENGSFDVNDKIIFYAESRDGFGKNMPLASYTNVGNQVSLDALGDFTYHNPYSKNGIYWLTWGSNETAPKRITQNTLSTFDKTRNFGKVSTHYQEVKVRRDLTGFNWFTQLLTGSANSMYSYPVTLNDLVTTEPQFFEIVMQSEFHLSSGRSISVKANNNNVLTHLWHDNRMAKKNNTGNFLTTGNNEIIISKSTAENIYLKYFLIEWYKTLRKQNNPLEFKIHDYDYNQRVQYSFINEQNQNVRAFQVDTFYQVSSLPVSNNTFIANGNDKTKIFLVSDNDLKRPSALNFVNVSSIDNTAPQHDVLIIYPDDFSAGAQRLYQIYQSHYGYNPLMVSQQTIFDNFSGGHPDPVAIKSYLHYLQLNSPEPKPKGAVLLGAGTIDFRNFYGKINHKNYIMVNQIHTNLFDSGRTNNTSDDYYAHFNTFIYPEIIIGRIPATSTQSLDSYLNKLEDYLDRKNTGLWQLKFQLIADDHIYRTSVTDTQHTEQAETASRFIENSIFVDKLYAMEYDLDAFKKKPQVRQKLIDNINEGRLFWYYIGHGSYSNLGDEWYFRLSTDLPSLNNYQKYPVFIAASCNVGEYDNPNFDSLGERLVLLNNAGSIVSIAATRECLGSSNTSLMNHFLQQNVVNQNSVGESLMRAKFSFSSAAGNNKYYNILGDPFLKPALPITTENIVFNPHSDTLKLRQTVNFDGDFNQNSLNQTVQTFVYDSGYSYRFMLPTGNLTGFTITHDNMSLFNGRSSISGGKYNTSFVIPDDAYPGNRGRIFSFAIDNTTGKAYLNKKTGINYSNQTIIVENNDKPDIQLFIDSENFKPGDTVSPFPTLIAKISDENGINTLGRPGHNIMIIIDGMSEPIIATQGFEYNLDSHTSGVLRWKLDGLQPGMHNLKLIVYDNFNEISLAETWFITSENIPLSIKNALVYPNPVKDSAHFTFDLSHNADVTINIFTITGRKIKTIRQRGLKQGYNQIFWNARDDDNDRIANNTYFYTINANASEGKGSTKITDKLMILR